MASSSYCYRLVGKYIDEMDRSKKQMEKNFQDMDVKNASIQADMYEVVQDMEQYCDELRRTIANYNFE